MAPRHLDIDRTPDQQIQEIVLTTNLTPLMSYTTSTGPRRRAKARNIDAGETFTFKRSQESRQ
jgi:hypothetical protein